MQKSISKLKGKRLLRCSALLDHSLVASLTKEGRKAWRAGKLTGQLGVSRRG